MAHPPALEAWSREGRWLEVGGRRLWVSDRGESGERPDLVCLHGFPSFAHDFHRVLPTLREAGRVIVHDHLGFGLSDKPKAHAQEEQHRHHRRGDLHGDDESGREHLQNKFWREAGKIDPMRINEFEAVHQCADQDVVPVESKKEQHIV